ncbi:hypothetical protein [Engelhardtia mirabilis]|uniref:Lipoprotein n=1 Tax=Engelhardtia mirabilis TaxID=2528011 RepID=A0A518BHZ4_9BACT|nr:hypothetical protein Pla133_16620 [Planctomycetes bacterium Pla133]QDV00912.1 hypothetical protein Pla86_16610 [Planctomycetes bacterium Pla86]
MSKLARVGIGAAALALLGLLTVTSCSSPLPRRDPTGELFPAAVGKSLEGEEVALPNDLLGEPALLLVGYVQDAQFDIDRWLLGLIQAQVAVRTVEVPTVRGLVPGLLSGTIDEGMRGGIPERFWGDVVTVYGDAAEIARFTGTEGPRNARVLLLDAQGRVTWFHDQGYAAPLIPELVDAVGRAGR